MSGLDAFGSMTYTRHGLSPLDPGYGSFLPPPPAPGVAVPAGWCDASPALRALDREGHPVATAEAQGGDPAAQPSLLQRVEQRRQDACAACADRMPERHRPAVDVDLGGVDAKLLKHGDQLD